MMTQCSTVLTSEVNGLTMSLAFHCVFIKCVKLEISMLSLATESYFAFS